MSHEVMERWCLDAVTILEDQSWADALDADGYRDAVVSIVAYLNHAAQD